MKATMNYFTSTRSKADGTEHGNTMPQERWVLIVTAFPSETEGIKQER